MIVYISLVIMILVCCYMYYKKKNRDIILNIIIIFFMLNLVMTIDLGVNFACSKWFNDGISINGILSKFVFMQNREWSVENFRNKYFTSMYISLAMLGFYVLNFIGLKNK